MQGVDPSDHEDAAESGETYDAEKICESIWRYQRRGDDEEALPEMWSDADSVA